LIIRIVYFIILSNSVINLFVISHIFQKNLERYHLLLTQVSLVSK